MKTLEQALSERLALLSSVESIAREILSDYCNRKGYLLIGRTKSFESLRDKIETGRYPDFKSVDDFVAFSVVIDTLGQEADVRRFLRKVFNVQLVRSGATLNDERIFDFDCTRIYCKIDDKSGLLKDQSEVMFEIQIRTLLQHAWSKITHPHVYKAKIFDARAGRLAAELMAHLENIDRSFSHFKTNSKTVKSVLRKEMIACTQITSMIDNLVETGIIPSELRPENGRRLGENIYNSIKRDKRQDISNVIGGLDAFFKNQKDRFPRSVTLFQLAIVFLHEHDLLERGGGRNPRRYYVTDELVSLFPRAAQIPNQVAL